MKHEKQVDILWAWFRGHAYIVKGRGVLTAPVF